MTTTETVAASCPDCHSQNLGCYNAAAQLMVCNDCAQIIDTELSRIRKDKRIESALASAEPVAYEERMRPVWDERAPWTPWERCSRESYENFVSKPKPWIANDWEIQRRSLYTHAKPAAKVEAPRRVFPPVAFEEWFADIWAGTDGIPVPPYQGDGWDAYIEKRQLALGAWVAATESAPTPASVPDAVLEVSRRLIREAIPATASGQTCFVPKYVIAQLADAIGFFTTPEPTP